MLKDQLTVTGTHVGDGNAKNISIGFKPRRVTVFNETDAMKWIWTDTMAAGKGFKTVTVGTQTFEAANGISHYAGTEAGNTEGFTLGTGVNIAAKTLHWIAER
ncbi:MAG: hypothetical protein FD174_2578 [Geobacteraceae bacterium]|nr:MAG: hypothetical protein FD174_2578 [Geobacteraceae bacterium]